ncbi:MAG: ATP synthase subunit C [Treponema sp.]|nr:ATP synthase subunit C [Treponema sp.]
MNKKIFAVAAALVCFAVAGLTAQAAGEAVSDAPVAVEAAAENTAVVQEADSGSAIKYVAAGLAVGLACIAGGMAVGKIGAAAMGAMSENAELSGKALPFVGLAEGICLWGFLVALLIIIL